LDAGCGVGPESLLFGLFGAEVIGVDLIPERLKLAVERKKFFESLLGDHLSIHFLNRDVFEVIQNQKFNAIWLREAISHIHPLEEFLDKLYQIMEPGAEIYISDTNWSNPINKVRLIRNYWRRYKFFHRLGEAGTFFVHSKYYDPVSGQSVRMVEERLFTLWKTQKLLRQAKFKIVQARTIGILPKRAISSLFPSRIRLCIFRLLCNIENALSFIPGLRALGMRNIVVALKPLNAQRDGSHS